jgi:hypothetical protein
MDKSVDAARSARLRTVDSRVLDLTWTPGVVHLYVDGKDVLTMAPEMAAWLAVCSSSCAEAARTSP